MTDWLLPALAGFGTGILSAWGVGGGTLLLLLTWLALGAGTIELLMGGIAILAGALGMGILLLISGLIAARLSMD